MSEPNEAIANISSLVLEQLHAIRATQAKHSEALASIRLELAAMGQQLGGLTTCVYSGKSEMDSLKRRIERIERRLEINS